MRWHWRIFIGLERAGMTCKGQVEINDYCKRILTKHWPAVPKWSNIKELCISELPSVDLICGGYPCQPFSFAEKRQGEKDDRHLWPYFSKIISYIKPTWCLFENVTGHIKLGLNTVLSDLESQGYSTQALSIPACGVDAPHKRERVWILAHTNNRYRRDIQSQNGTIGSYAKWQEKASDVADAGKADRERILAYSDYSSKPGLCTTKKKRIIRRGGFAYGCGTIFEDKWMQWAAEPGVGRVVNGLPYRLDRIRALGNAVVPNVVEVLGRAILVAHYQKNGLAMRFVDEIK